jgi:predicted nucleotidyltransferase
MKKFEEIKKKLIELKPFLKEKYKIKEIGIFGSYIKGKQREESDLDILIDFEDDVEIGLIEFIRLENYLSDILGVKVDLVLKKTLKPYIGKIILKEIVYL